METHINLRKKLPGTRLCWLLLCLTPLWTSCHDVDAEKELHGLPGVWMLSQVDFHGEHIMRFPQEGTTFCRIIGRDTTFYECRLHYTPSGTIILPTDKGDFELIYKGNHEFIYLENGFLRPLQMPDDTTLVIQKNGNRYTWLRNNEMTEKRIREIRGIIAQDSMDADSELMRYVLSTSERELRATNHRLAYLASALALAVCFILYHLRKLSRHKRAVERQLAQISEEQAMRPPVVTDAFKQVEEDFFRSDYYTRLHRRVTEGEVLREADWQEMEQEIRPVYPDFVRRLSGLCKMSNVEQHVCLLIKLRFSPTEMAAVLCKDISTISTIRSRLYKKVFNRKGGAKDWDNFILSL